MTRFRNWVQRNSWWSDEEETELRGSIRKEVGSAPKLAHFSYNLGLNKWWCWWFQVLKALQVAEKTEKPSLQDLFNDVYEQVPANLQEQEKSLRQTITRHHQDFPADVPV